MAAMDSQSLYRALDSRNRHFRLLRLNKADGPDLAINPLNAELAIHSLDQCPQFDCISYAWGSEVGGHTLPIAGNAIPVTRNLHDVLCILRDAPSAFSYIWVDALCINQQNLAERCQQVTLMGEIFSKASTVHIWLGRGDDTTANTLHMVDRASQRSTLHQPDLHLLQGAIDGLESRDLEMIFRNTWWDRLWTIQEAVLATNPQARLGDHSIYFPRLLMGILAIFRLRNQNQPGRTLSYYMMRLALKFAAPIMAASESNRRDLKSIPDLLAALRGSQVTVMHDRIYAILGLLSRELGIVPDYSVPLDTVYVDFILRVIQYERSLDILALCETRAAQLPSWATVFQPPGQFLFRAVSGCDASKASKSQDLFDYPETVADRLTNGQLRVWTHLLGSVELVLSPFPADVPGNFLSCASEERDEATTAVWGILQAGITLGERWSSQGQQFREWLFVRDQQKYSDVYDAMLSSLIGSKKCRLFATAGGSYLGMVSGQAREGDILAILARASTPWLLRRKESGTEPVFELVGDAFSPNLMHGEAVVRASITLHGSADNVTNVFHQVSIA